jgi:hypothetical protein
MPIKGKGWEMLITRIGEQHRGRKSRIVGEYQVYHDGDSVDLLCGMTAESPGPGNNKIAGCGKCIERGTYPLLTQAGERYVTLGYRTGNIDIHDYPQPGIELGGTGGRREILIHPGAWFLKSIGCINLAGDLRRGDDIDWVKSRWRVIAIIEDLKDFFDEKFPNKNGQLIPGAHVIIDVDSH